MLRVFRPHFLFLAPDSVFLPLLFPFLSPFVTFSFSSLSSQCAPHVRPALHLALPRTSVWATHSSHTHATPPLCAVWAPLKHALPPALLLPDALTHMPMCTTEGLTARTLDGPCICGTARQGRPRLLRMLLRPLGLQAGLLMAMTLMVSDVIDRCLSSLSGS